MITVDFILENKNLWKKYKEEINKFTKKIIIDLITEKPDIISVIDLDRLDKWGIYLILMNHPGLIRDLKPYLDKLDTDGIYWILRHQPKLIKDLEPYLDGLNKRDLSYIIMYQPELFPYLKLYLDKLGEWQISYISGERPELYFLFKYVGTEHQDAAYYCAYPSEISKLDEEEKQELSKKLAELIREEKLSLQLPKEEER